MLLSLLSFFKYIIIWVRIQWQFLWQKRLPRDALKTSPFNWPHFFSFYRFVNAPLSYPSTRRTPSKPPFCRTKPPFFPRSPSPIEATVDLWSPVHPWIWGLVLICRMKPPPAHLSICGLLAHPSPNEAISPTCSLPQGNPRQTPSVRYDKLWRS